MSFIKFVLLYSIFFNLAKSDSVPCQDRHTCFDCVIRPSRYAYRQVSCAWAKYLDRNHCVPINMELSGHNRPLFVLRSTYDCGCEIDKVKSVLGPDLIIRQEGFPTPPVYPSRITTEIRSTTNQISTEQSTSKTKDTLDSSRYEEMFITKAQYIEMEDKIDMLTIILIVILVLGTFKFLHFLCKKACTAPFRVKLATWLLGDSREKTTNLKISGRVSNLRASRNTGTRNNSRPRSNSSPPGNTQNIEAIRESDV